MIRVLALASLFVLAACGGNAPPLVASDVVVKRPVPGMQMTAGYLTLHNNSGEDIEIGRVTSPQFGKVEMHETVIADGVASMSALGTVVIPAGSSLQFRPGGKHLMLMRPGANLEQVTLEFYSGDTIVLAVSVPAGD
jgi:copper(I)-binding protein